MEKKVITSTSNEIIKYACKLKNNSFMKRERKFLIEGEHLVKMAKDNLEAVFLVEEELFNYKATQYIVSKNIMEKLSSGKSPSKIIGICNFLPMDNPFKCDKIIYLDGVQDPGNVGTIIRTALSFGFDNIILSEDSAFIYNQKLIQASQGSIFKENINFATISMLKCFKENGYTLIGTSLKSTSINLSNFSKIPAKYVLILGNEGKGMRKEVEDLCDLLLKIEMSNIDSLNVGVASGVLLYELRRKEGEKDL